MVTSSKPTFKQTLLSLCKCNFTQTWSAKGKTQRVHTTNWQRWQLMPWFLESLWGMAAPVPWSFTALLRLAVPTGVSSTHGVIIDGPPPGCFDPAAMHSQCTCTHKKEHTLNKQLRQLSRNRQTTLCSWTRTSLIVQCTKFRFITVDVYRLVSVRCMPIWLCTYYLFQRWLTAYCGFIQLASTVQFIVTNVSQYKQETADLFTIFKNTSKH